MTIRSTLRWMRSRLKMVIDRMICIRMLRRATVLERGDID